MLQLHHFIEELRGQITQLRDRVAHLERATGETGPAEEPTSTSTTSTSTSSPTSTSTPAATTTETAATTVINHYRR